MERRTLTMWVAVVAAGVLVACGAEQEDTSVLGATTEREEETTTEREQQAASEDDEGPAQSDSSEQQHTERTERSDRKDDGETPWHLLPEDDRPVPVEQPDCERASLTPVAC